MQPPLLPSLELFVRDMASLILPIDATKNIFVECEQGDGHPVLVLPAFLTGDWFTEPLRKFLKKLGYFTYGWNMGLNIGPTPRILKGVEHRLEQINKHHNCKVTLIGHSLGGTMARELAKKRPDIIRDIILLASPIRFPMTSYMLPIYRLFSACHKQEYKMENYHSLSLNSSTPPLVPVTAIFSRQDGIVSWRSCLEVPGLNRENIETDVAHTTMIRNPKVWSIITNSLAKNKLADKFCKL